MCPLTSHQISGWGRGLLGSHCRLAPQKVPGSCWAPVLLAWTRFWPPLLVFPYFPCTETGQGIVHALTDLSSPGMTSGNGNSASSIAGTAPQNGENKPPQAIVKPQILTHVIEGFVIQEGAEPFPVRTTSFPLFFLSFLFFLSIIWMCIRIFYVSM